MNRVATIVIGAGLHLLVVLVPALAMRADALSPAIGMLLAIGLTAFFLADAVRSDLVLERKNDGRDRQARCLALANGLAMLGLCWLSLITGATLSIASALPWIGLAMMLGGAALRHAAIRALGENFVTEVTVTASQRLVRAGIYSYIRHPSETGLLLGMLGVAVLLSSWMGFAFWLIVLIPLALWRLQLEEAALRAAYGDDYSTYAATVGGLLPRLRFSALPQSAARAAAGPPA
jgi:protein-S-isoprenylcysteine O-methyltransferase Ste14